MSSPSKFAPHASYSPTSWRLVGVGKAFAASVQKPPANDGKYQNIPHSARHGSYRARVMHLQIDTEILPAQHCAKDLVRLSC